MGEDEEEIKGESGERPRSTWLSGQRSRKRRNRENGLVGRAVYRRELVNAVASYCPTLASVLTTHSYWRHMDVNVL